MKTTMYNWIWKWHFIGGIVSLPIVLLLSITGIIYLFKDTIEQPHIDKLTKVEITDTKHSYQDQWHIAKNTWKKPVQAMIIPKRDDEATVFTSGRFSGKSSLYINPYTGKTNGEYQLKQQDIYKVRKLHGELLLGKFGTKIVELVASWMVVLILTGIYLFYPRNRGIKGLFIVRYNHGKRILFRDLHSVIGVWFSALLLIILFGGLPWTDVWGSGFKWVQQQTNTGFPKAWQGHAFKSDIKGDAITLDTIVAKAKQLNLEGITTIALPQSPKSVYSISNKTYNLSKMKMIHLDQYSGNVIEQLTWDDIGILMRARLWLMAFHQGQFGTWNLVLVLITALGLLFSSVMALLMYSNRKKRASDWNVPSLASKSIGIGTVSIVILLGIFLPLFGISLLLIQLIVLLQRRKGSNIA